VAQATVADEIDSDTFSDTPGGYGVERSCRSPPHAAIVRTKRSHLEWVGPPNCRVAHTRASTRLVGSSLAGGSLEANSGSANAPLCLASREPQVTT
jgi:hypothetical protein